MMDPEMLPQVQGIGSVYDGPRQVQGIGSVYDGPRDVATSTRHRVSI